MTEILSYLTKRKGVGWNFKFTGTIELLRFHKIFCDFFQCFTHLVVIVAGFETAGCSSPLSEDSLSELPAAKNLDSAIILLNKV